MSPTDKSNLTRPVLSFDFDGVLNASVVDTEPTSFTDPESWIPFSEMIEHIRMMSDKYRCVVVTARDNWNRAELLRFIEIHDIPIEEVYCTDDGPKLPVLLELDAVAHFDDRLSVGKEIKGSGIDFWQVNTRDRNWMYKWC
jgi:hypothetical protein